MFAIVKMGGNQYHISEGDVIEVNRLETPKGEACDVEEVLLYADGEDIRIGRPYLKDVTIKAKVLDLTLDDKKIAFKYKKRKASATKKGHRQKLTALKISKIQAT